MEWKLTRSPHVDVAFANSVPQARCYLPQTEKTEQERGQAGRICTACDCWRKEPFEQRRHQRLGFFNVISSTISYYFFFNFVFLYRAGRTVGHGHGHGLLLVPDVRLLPPDGAHVGDGEPVHVPDRDVHGRHGIHVLHVQHGGHAGWVHVDGIFKVRSPRIDFKESIPLAYVAWARICKRIRSLGIDSKESIPPAYVAWRAGTTNKIILFLGSDSWDP